MTRDEDDITPVTVWRGAAGETPGALLDARILGAARAQLRRRFLIPAGALLAACLTLALYMTLTGTAPVPQASPVALDTSTFGLHVRQDAHLPIDHALMQKLIRQQPGGSVYTEIVHK